MDMTPEQALKKFQKQLADQSNWKARQYRGYAQFEKAVKGEKK